MRLIKDAKLFGILNLLDIIIILSVVALILPMVHYYIRFNEKGLIEQRLLDSYIKRQMRGAVGHQKGPQAGDIEIYASFKSVKKEDLNKIKVHDKEILPNGTTIAEILWLGKPSPNYFNIDLTSGIFIRTLPDTSLYSLPVRLRLKGIVQDNGLFSYKTKELKQLSFHIFNSGTYEANFVIEMPPLKIEEEMRY